MARFLILVLCASIALALRGHAQQQLSTHLRAGAKLLQEQKFPEAVAAFEALVREDPEDGEAWYQLGLAHHFSRNYDQAIRCDFLAIQFVKSGHPFRVSATYNAACVYALQGKAERALQWLHRARNAGFKDAGLVVSDTDLASLRDDPRFGSFMATLALKAPADDSVVTKTVTPIMVGGSGGVEIDAEGLLYVASFGADVWTVQPDGTWEVLATGFVKAADCTLDGAGNLLQVDHGDNKVWSIAKDGKRTDLQVQRLNGPVGIDTAADGSFYVTSFRDDTILHVGADGSAQAVAQRELLNGPNGIAFAGDAGLFVVNYNDGAVLQIDPKSGAQRILCELPGGGNGHVVWNGQALYVTARAGHRVFRVTLEGGFTLVAGSGAKGTQDGGATTSTLSLPNGIALSRDGSSLFINESLPGNRSLVRRLDIK